MSWPSAVLAGLLIALVGATIGLADGVVLWKVAFEVLFITATMAIGIHWWENRA